MTSAAIQTPRDHDRELAARCTAGERAAQRQLFAEQKGVVHRTLFRVLGANRDMEDLLQESFLEVFRSLGNFRGESKLSTWVSAIAARVAIAYIQRRKPMSASLEAVPEIASDDPDTVRRLHAREAARRLYAALEHVEARQRVAFTLHAIDGRSLAEVAEITGATLVATKTRVWRARRELDKRAAKDPVLRSFLVETVDGERSP
jgi:RNA polymerase sigma-70 factor, ECF subfamily